MGVLSSAVETNDGRLIQTTEPPKYPERFKMTEMEDRNFIVVGSGAAGLVGAINAHRAGLKPVIIEKSSVWGGTTAISGGVLWIPCNHIMEEQGAPDSAERARQYLMRLLGDNPSRRQIAKVDAFMEAGPEMVRMLSEQGVRWLRATNHPDYYQNVEGAGVGRCIESRIFDGKRAGERLKTLRALDLQLPAMSTTTAAALVRVKTGVGPFLTAAAVMGRQWAWTAIGRKPFGWGRALMANLMAIAMKNDIPLLLETRLVGLQMKGDAVVGANVETKDGPRVMRASAGVLLSAGGFAHNPMLRRKYQGNLDGSWTNAIPEDQGDALLAAMQIGADTELTDDCWWMPSVVLAANQVQITLTERTLPGSIIVDEMGRRYMDEAQSYMVAGKIMRDHGAAERPHWLIFDQRYRNRYVIAWLSGSQAVQRMQADGFLKTSSTIAGLAEEIGVSPTALGASVSQINDAARTGVDQAFGRGGNRYDLFWGDPAHKPNPSLGEISKAPFYAVQMRPGDLGTNGGIKTDEHARVLTAQDKPIEGLYAAGNGSGSPFGRTYPGAGGTIGPAATFGYLAAKHAAQRRGPPQN